MKNYYMLTKPGIIFGNIITTACGFALGSQGHFEFGLLIAAMIGLSLVIGAAGVFNNYMDRAMDAKMKRTKDRGFATGVVSVPKAMIFGASLVVSGLIILSVFTNLLTVLAAFTGFFIYLFLYTFLKYHTLYGTIIGSIAGGIPPVVGYCAASDRLDEGALLLFLILVLWQMPHFFAIAIYRFDDYTAASIPVLPIVKGMYATKVHMILYIMAFILCCLMLSLTRYTGLLYGVITIFLGISWLVLCISGIRQTEPSQERRWAQQMFRFSLIVIMGICLAIPLDLVVLR